MLCWDSNHKEYSMSQLPGIKGEVVELYLDTGTAIVVDLSADISIVAYFLSNGEWVRDTEQGIQLDRDTFRRIAALVAKNAVDPVPPSQGVS